MNVAAAPMDTASPSRAEKIASLPREERAALLRGIDAKQLDALWHDWAFWARPEQVPPFADPSWDVFLLLGGRGSGKTRPAAEIIHQWAEEIPGGHFALVGQNAAECRDTMAEGESGLLPTAKPWNLCTYEPSKRRITWANGSWATFFSGDAPDQLRGPNASGAWVDEFAKFQYPQQCWDNLEMLNRVGKHPRMVVSTTPKPIKPLIDLIADKPFTLTRTYSTYRNQANLAPTYIRRMLARYEGTRLGQQELHAEMLEDNPAALWSRKLLEATRVQAPHYAHNLLAIGIDPPGGLVTECGIVAALRGVDSHGYVVADRSLAGKPEAWAKATWDLALWLYDEYDVVPHLIAEKNHGGEMVRATLDTARPQGCLFPVELVTASESKYARAEPVQMLYEQQRFHHVGSFGALESEMCTWSPFDEEGDMRKSVRSPNRLDALVWAAYGLKMIGKKKVAQAW